MIMFFILNICVKDAVYYLPVQGKIKLVPLCGWDPHSTNCQICYKMKLIIEGIIGTQKRKLQKMPLCTTKTNTTIWTQPALETLRKELHNLTYYLKINLKDFAPDINPHLHLYVEGICENLLRKPLMMKSCQHVSCFICLSSFLKSKPEYSTFYPTCSAQFIINDISHSTHTYNIINILMLSCKICNTKHSPI